MANNYHTPHNYLPVLRKARLLLRHAEATGQVVEVGEIIRLGRQNGLSLYETEALIIAAWNYREKPKQHHRRGIYQDGVPMGDPPAPGAVLLFSVREEHRPDQIRVDFLPKGGGAAQTVRYSAGDYSDADQLIARIQTETHLELSYQQLDQLRVLYADIAGVEAPAAGSIARVAVPNRPQTEGTSEKNNSGKSSCLSWGLAGLVFVAVLSLGLWWSGAFQTAEVLYSDYGEWRRNKLEQLDCIGRKLEAAQLMEVRTDFTTTIELRRSELLADPMIGRRESTRRQYERLFDVFAVRLENVPALSVEECF